MDGLVAIGLSMIAFLLVCCCCSLWQAWHMQKKKYHFDELHSKYSRENVNKLKDRRKQTAKEIMLLREEVKIAEERLLAEHKYEQTLMDKLSKKETESTLKRRKKRKPEKNKKRHEFDISHDNESDSDIEDLLEKYEFHKTDIEAQSKDNLKTRSISHKKKDNGYLEKAFEYFYKSPKKLRLSDTSSDDEDGRKSKKPHSKFFKLDWAPFRRRRKSGSQVKPYSSNIQSSPQSREQIRDHYIPNSARPIDENYHTEVNKSELETTIQEVSITPPRSNQRKDHNIIEIESNNTTPFKSPILQPKANAVLAWDSPESPKNKSPLPRVFKKKGLPPLKNIPKLTPRRLPNLKNLSSNPNKLKVQIKPVKLSVNKKAHAFISEDFPSSSSIIGFQSSSITSEILCPNTNQVFDDEFEEMLKYDEGLYERIDDAETFKPEHALDDDFAFQNL